MTIDKQKPSVITHTRPNHPHFKHLDLNSSVHLQDNCLFTSILVLFSLYNSNAYSLSNH